MSFTALFVIVRTPCGVAQGDLTVWNCQGLDGLRYPVQHREIEGHRADELRSLVQILDLVALARTGAQRKSGHLANRDAKTLSKFGAICPLRRFKNGQQGRP